MKMLQLGTAHSALWVKREQADEGQIAFAVGSITAGGFPLLETSALDATHKTNHYRECLLLSVLLLYWLLALPDW